VVIGGRYDGESEILIVSGVLLVALAARGNCNEVDPLVIGK